MGKRGTRKKKNFVVAQKLIRTILRFYKQIHLCQYDNIHKEENGYQKENLKTNNINALTRPLTSSDTSLRSESNLQIDYELTNKMTSYWNDI